MIPSAVFFEKEHGRVRADTRAHVRACTSRASNLFWRFDRRLKPDSGKAVRGRAKRVLSHTVYSSFHEAPL